MHLPSILNAPKDDEIGTNSENAFAKCKTQDDIFALDKELMQIFEQTYGPVTRRKHAPEKRHVKAVSSIDKAAEKYKNPPCMTARSICSLTATMLFLRGNTSKSFPKEVLTVQGTL